MNAVVEERYSSKFYRKEWMSDDQWECAQLLADLMGGFHHVKAIKDFGLGICTNLWPRLSTYDFNDLTRAVFMAHDRCIRLEVLPSGPGMLKLSLHKRHKREGSVFERHPTIETALAEYRKNWSLPSEGSGT
jgi:hypothetical protein